MQVSKIKNAAAKLEIHYDREDGPQGDDHETVKLVSGDTPRPEFGRAWYELSETLLKDCTLERYHGDAVLKQLDIDHSEDTGEVSCKAVYAIKLTELNGVMKVEFPTLREHSEDEDGIKNRIRPVTTRALHALLFEAKAFIRGQRAQGRMSLDPDAGEGSELDREDDGTTRQISAPVLMIKGRTDEAHGDTDQAAEDQGGAAQGTRDGATAGEDAAGSDQGPQAGAEDDQDAGDDHKPAGSADGLDDDEEVDPATGEISRRAYRPANERRVRGRRHAA